VKTYEAMFLMDPSMSNDWPAAEAELKRILDRAEARVLGIKNWDERKLAYPMGQYKRGLYALAFFEAAPEKIAGIERDVQLSERLLRVLVLRRDRMTREHVQKALEAAPPPKTFARGSDEWSGRPRAGGPDSAPGRIAETAGAVAVEVPEDLPDVLEAGDAE